MRKDNAGNDAVAPHTGNVKEEDGNIRENQPATGNGLPSATCA